MADKKSKAPAETPVNNVEIFDDEGAVITLHDDKDNPVDFIQVAGVDFEGHFYALLRPMQKIDGIDEDEVVIFRLEEGKDGEDDVFAPVESEELLNKVFDQYLRAAADENDSCCGDDCDDDGCDCGCGCGHGHDE